jgi:hypothetical protein
VLLQIKRCNIEDCKFFPGLPSCSCRGK